MQSWVRYSVAVYIGLLLAGVLVSPTPNHYLSGPIPGEQRSARPAPVPPIPLPARTVDDPVIERKPVPSGTLNS